MKHRILGFCFLVIGGMALGNPIAIPNPNAVFVAEEKLEIQLGADAALIQCHVVFRQKPGERKTNLTNSARIEVPVWIPSDYEVKRVRELERLSSTGFRDDVKKAEVVFHQLCDIRVQISGRPAEIDGSYLSKKPGHGSDFPAEAYPSNYYCLVYSFDLPLPLKESGTKVSLTWHQPHRVRSKNERQFFYLPLLPIDETTVPAPFGNYARTAAVQCDKHVTAALSWNARDACTVSAGATASLSLSHLQALKIAVINPKAQ